MKMTTGFIERLFEVINLIKIENERLRVEVVTLRVKLKNLTSDLPEEQQKKLMES